MCNWNGPRLWHASIHSSFKCLYPCWFLGYGFCKEGASTKARCELTHGVLERSFGVFKLPLRLTKIICLAWATYVRAMSQLTTHELQHCLKQLPILMRPLMPVKAGCEGMTKQYAGILIALPTKTISISDWFSYKITVSLVVISSPYNQSIATASRNWLVLSSYLAFEAIPQIQNTCLHHQAESWNCIFTLGQNQIGKADQWQCKAYSPRLAGSIQYWKYQTQVRAASAHLLLKLLALLLQLFGNSSLFFN